MTGQHFFEDVASARICQCFTHFVKGSWHLLDFIAAQCISSDFLDWPSEKWLRSRFPHMSMCRKSKVDGLRTRAHSVCLWVVEVVSSCSRRRFVFGLRFHGEDAHGKEFAFLLRCARNFTAGVIGTVQSVHAASQSSVWPRPARNAGTFFTRLSCVQRMFRGSCAAWCRGSQSGGVRVVECFLCRGGVRIFLCFFVHFFV